MEGIENTIRTLQKTKPDTDALLIILLHEYQINQTGIRTLKNQILQLSENTAIKSTTIGQMLEEDPSLVKATNDAWIRLREATTDPRPILASKTMKLVGFDISTRLAQRRDVLQTGQIRRITETSNKIQTIRWAILVIGIIGLTITTCLFLRLIDHQGYTYRRRIITPTLIGSCLLIALGLAATGHARICIEILIYSASPITLITIWGTR